MIKKGTHLKSLIFSTLIISFGSCQAASEIKWYPILWLDSTMAAAKAFSSELTDNRYFLLGTREMRATEGRRSRLLSEIVYAIDCQTPRRMKVIVMRTNWAAADDAPDDWKNTRAEDVPEKFKVQDLDYESIDNWIAKNNRALLDAGLKRERPELLSVAVEFGCSSYSTPIEKHADLAEKVSTSGGQADTKELVCEYSLPGGQVKSAEVAFSEEIKAIRWNDRWRKGTFVSDTRLSITSGSTQILINRATGAISVSFDGITGTGQCAPKSAISRKF